MQKNTIIRQLIPIEIKLGFINIPSYGVALMPDEKTRIKVKLAGKEKDLQYNAKLRRIFGLTSWYREQGAQPKDEVEIHKLAENHYEFKLKRKSEELSKTEEREDLVDLSGLTSQAKGDIVEDRVKELILLHGQGLLSVYKPVTDTEGIDLIVVRNGQFHPLFLQVKGRYNLHQGRSLILSVKERTFTPHLSFFVIGVFFNPEKLELDENILLIPSTDLAKKASTAKAKNGDWYRIVSSISEEYTGKWSNYLIKKDELATKLIEKFEEMHQYIK